MKKPTINKELIRSFGRINGRKLRPGQIELMEELLPQVRFQVSDIRYQGDDKGRKQLPDTYYLTPETYFEIGFGYGEHLAGMALKYPDVNCIGCEPFVNGVATLLKHIRDNNIKNIRIFHGDARLLVDALPDACIDRLFILFPDPWPKLRHNKKRIISKENLVSLARVVKPGGMLEIATDHVDYGNWIAEHLQAQEDFKENTEIGAATKPEDWVPTRYQEKAMKEGRGARFFNYVRDDS